MLDLIVLHGEFSLFTVRGNFWYQIYRNRRKKVLCSRLSLITLTISQTPDALRYREIGKTGTWAWQARATGHAFSDGRRAMRLSLNLTFFYHLYSTNPLSSPSNHSFMFKTITLKILCVLDLNLLISLLYVYIIILSFSHFETNFMLIR